MSCRGRGTLTVRRSDNPFFQTTTGDIGQDFTKEVEYAAPTVERAPPRRTLVDNYDFGFLYEKMSDDIGAGQHHAPSNLSRAMGAQDTPAQLTRLKTMGAPASAATIAAAESRPSAADRVERILEIYKHAPKKEHEMYMTTSNFGAICRTMKIHRRAARAEPSSSAAFRRVKPSQRRLTTAAVAEVEQSIAVDARIRSGITPSSPRLCQPPARLGYPAGFGSGSRARRRAPTWHGRDAGHRPVGVARVLRALGVALEPGEERAGRRRDEGLEALFICRARAERPVGARTRGHRRPRRRMTMTTKSRAPTGDGPAAAAASRPPRSSRRRTTRARSKARAGAGAAAAPRAPPPASRTRGRRAGAPCSRARPAGAARAQTHDERVAPVEDGQLRRRAHERDGAHEALRRAELARHLQEQERLHERHGDAVERHRRMGAGC